MKAFWTAILITVAAGELLLGSEAFRTDINPALLYYQGFSLKPEMSQQDHDYLFTNEWRNQVLDERASNLIATYKNSFKLFYRAGKSQVPCDWGLDLSDGPEALLPGLAKAKNAAQTARLRVMWHLQNGRPEQARDDLLAAFVLGRNVSTDHVLISALVQYAIESILASVIAENYYQFPPETLRQIAEGIDAAPPRGPVAICVGKTERASFAEYFTRKIEGFRAEEGQESRALERTRAMLLNAFTEEEDGAAHPGGARRTADKVDKVLRVAGGTTEGVLKLFHELFGVYDRVAQVLSLPAAEYPKAMEEFQAFVKTHPNPLVQEFFPVFDNCRRKEFAAEIIAAMARAGIEYKLHGAEGLNSVLDPCTGEPFEFERFVFDGVDRGFRLRSKYRARDFDEVLIFVETPGPAFKTTGKNAGQKAN